MNSFAVYIDCGDMTRRDSREFTGMTHSSVLPCARLRVCVCRKHHKYVCKYEAAIALIGKENACLKGACN